MKRLKDILKQQAERATGARGAIVTVVGGYFIYMAFKMLENTRTGVSSMSMPLTVTLMSVMLLAGGLVIAYGGFLFTAGWNNEKKRMAGDDRNDSDDNEKGEEEP